MPKRSLYTRFIKMILPFHVWDHSYQIGLSDGYARKAADAYDLGHRRGHEQGYAEALNGAYDMGYAAGWADAKEEGNS